MIPADLGLPDTFAEFRDVQLQALQAIRESKAKVMLIQAPTGSGKSLIAAAAGKMLQMPVIYASGTKQLQDQFHDLFPSSIVLKGRSNYPTYKYGDNFPEITAADCDKDHGICTWCGDVYDCAYEQIKNAALRAEYAVMNFSYMMSEFNYVGRFSDDKDESRIPHLIVLDEGDTIEHHLMAFMQVTLAIKRMMTLGITAPRFKTPNDAHKMEYWLPWIGDTIAELDKHRFALDNKIAMMTPGGTEYAKRKRELSWFNGIISKLTFMQKDLANDPAAWIRADDLERLIFKPVYVSAYADDLLWRHGARWLVMSATILSVDQFCQDLGLNHNDVEFLDLPSTFPVERRPILYLPIASMKMNERQESIPKIIRAVDEILDSAPARVSVLIHTHTYALTQAVMKGSRHKARMMTHTNADSREQVLSDFKATEGAILVSPSMDRGVDLPDDLCRIQIVCQVPKPYLGDRQIATRFYAGRNGRRWYALETIRSLCQMTGRGMRHKDDYCQTWILDSEFGRLLTESGKYIPRWWRDAVVMIGRHQIREYAEEVTA